MLNRGFPHASPQRLEQKKKIICIIDPFDHWIIALLYTLGKAFLFFLLGLTEDGSAVNITVDDTEMLRISPDYTNMTQCSLDPSPIFQAFSVKYGNAVKMANGNPLLSAGNIHLQQCV